MVDNSDSSDYSDIDEEEDDVGDDDGVYDWFAFDTKAGMESIENQASQADAAPAQETKANPAMKDQAIRSEIDMMLKDSDDESDESEAYDLVDGEDEEVYDWTEMNTAKGLQEIEKVRRREEGGKRKIEEQYSIQSKLHTNSTLLTFALRRRKIAPPLWKPRRRSRQRRPRSSPSQSPGRSLS